MVLAPDSPEPLCLQRDSCRDKSFEGLGFRGLRFPGLGLRVYKEVLAGVSRICGFTVSKV